MGLWTRVAIIGVYLLMLALVLVFNYGSHKNDGEEEQ